ncbi:MAG: amidase [Cyanophyceae cyanobacterium]
MWKHEATRGVEAEETPSSAVRQGGVVHLGSLPYTEPRGFLPTRHPWNLDYTAGGSSGGAASAVAAGLCPVAHGSDGGGSLRGPAACCGLVGIKPARGRVSHAPVGDRQSGISSDGPLACTVTDAAALLDIMSGYIPGNPYWLPESESFLAATQTDPQPLRIAFSLAVSPVGEAAAEIQQSVIEIVELLAMMGHVVEPDCPDFSELVEPFIQVWSAGVAAAGLPLEALSPMNGWIAQQSGHAGEYLQAVTKMQIVARQIVQFFDAVDVLVLPTYMHPPIRIGEWSQLEPEATLRQIIHWIAPCPPFNASGLPAIALPTGFDSRDLPRSVQLVGKPAAESTLFSLAAQIESAQPWSHHRPAVAA